MEKGWHGLLGLGLHAAYLHHLRALKGTISDSLPSGWPFAVSPRALVSGGSRARRQTSVQLPAADKKFDCNPRNACVPNERSDQNTK